MEPIRFAFTRTTNEAGQPAATLPGTVFTVVEQGFERASVIGVFEDRSKAMEVAIAYASYRLTRCCIRAAATSGTPKPDLTAYIFSIETEGETAQIFIRHQATGMPDDLTWCVRSFELVRSQL